MKKLSILFGLLMITAIAISGCSPTAAEPLAAETIPQQNYLITEGRLVPAHYLDLSFSVPGQVIEVLVQEGDNVVIGQVIAKMDVPYTAMVAFSQNQLEAQNSKIALEEMKKNADVNLAQSKLNVFIAQNELDEAQEDFDADDNEENQLRLNVAQANLDLAKKNLSIFETGSGIDKDKLAAAESRVNTAMTALLSAQSVIDSYELKTNVGGTVANINVQAGERINAGYPVMTIADFSNWQIKTDNLTEINVVKVKSGQKVEIILDALPEQTFTGQIAEIAAVYKEERGDTTYTATIVMDQSDPLMRWGMTAAIQFLP
jgi:multidrug resistance efflux pump